MSPQSLIILLTLLGFLMLAGEVFVPGMVLGVLGGLSLVGAVVAAYTAYGPVTGSVVFAGIALVVMAGFVAWMFAFPHTPIGRRVMLRRSLETGLGDQSKPPNEMLGMEGVAFTTLRPAGTARFGERKVDVVAEGAFIPEGSKVVVVAQEGIRVVVRQAG